MEHKVKDTRSIQGKIEEKERFLDELKDKKTQISKINVFGKINNNRKIKDLENEILRLEKRELKIQRPPEIINTETVKEEGFKISETNEEDMFKDLKFEDLENAQVENESLTKTQEKEAIEIIEKLSEEEKEKIGLGFKTIGYNVEKSKNDLFANIFEKIAKRGDGKISKFSKELSETFKRDSEKAYETALKIKSGTESHNLKNTSLLLGNTLKYSRFFLDAAQITIGSPVRYVMMGAMALSRGSEAAKEVHLKNEEVIEKTRIQDAEKAADEAWKIYEKAINTSPNGEVSAKDLGKAYLNEMPKDLSDRLKNPKTGNSWIQKMFSKKIENDIEKINEKILIIEKNPQINEEQKEIKRNLILAKYEKKLKDYDRILTQYGTVDEVAMWGRFGETLGKGIVVASSIETAGLLIHRLYDTIAHVQIDTEAVTQIKTEVAHQVKNVIKNSFFKDNVQSGNITKATENIHTPIKESFPESNLKNSVESLDKTTTKITSNEIKNENLGYKGKEGSVLKNVNNLKEKILEKLDPKNITVVHKGEGMEHPIIRQIMSDEKLAKDLGYKGDIHDTEALKQFAGKEAHILAIKNGFVSKDGNQIWIKEGDKISFELKIENGHPIIIEKTIDGKTIEIHNADGKVEESINKYETKHKIYGKELEDEIKGQDKTHIKEILESQNNGKLTEYEEIKIEKNTTGDINKETIEEVRERLLKNSTKNINSFESGLTDKIIKEIASVQKTNLKELFPKNQEILDYVKMNAEEWFAQDKETVNETFKPFLTYIHELEKTTDVKPRGESYIQKPETIEEYINRALKTYYSEKGVILKVLKDGKIEK